MFKLEVNSLAQAINAAKQLKADTAVLYAGEHGVLFATRSDVGTFMRLLSKQSQDEFSVLMKLEELTTATHRVKEMEMDIRGDHVQLKPKGIRSAIRLAAEPAQTGDMLDLWKGRDSGKPAPMLTKMLSENRELFVIKDHVGNKPVPVHIRWNKEGVAAGMSDVYHGLSIRTQQAPGPKDKSRELFVYSSWLPLLLDFIMPTEEKEKQGKKDGEQIISKTEKPLLTITEQRISVSTSGTLLVLQSIVPGAETITLNNIAEITGGEQSNKVKIDMAAINAALQRSLAVLPKEASIKFSTKSNKPEMMRIEGVHDSGSRIIEEVETSRSKKPFAFTTTVYNMLDVTNAKVPSCHMGFSGKAVTFVYSFGSKSDTIYDVAMFSVMSAS